MPAHPEFHVWETEDTTGAEEAVARWRPHLVERVLDLGCGEGHLLGALKRAGIGAAGVELNPVLAERAASRGLDLHVGDAVEFMESNSTQFRTFTMLDFVEHVPFEVTDRVLAAIPSGGSVIIQTPNTNSIIGHQFYMQVPSHVAPYSPFVLGRMLARHGIHRVDEGTVYGGLPWRGVRRWLTEALLVKVLGTVTTRLLTEGANYWLIGRKP